MVIITVFPLGKHRTVLDLSPQDAKKLLSQSKLDIQIVLCKLQASKVTVGQIFWPHSIWPREAFELIAPRLMMTHSLTN